MRKIGFALALTALMVVPSIATSAPTKADTKAASKECHDLRAAMGKENFNAQYGTFGKCVSAKRREEAAERRAARRQARQDCKQQGLKGREYAHCVKSATKANKAEADAKDEERVNAAKTCRDEQKGDPAAFQEKYGTNKNKRNAFGKCVSQTAKAQHDSGDDDTETETETTG